jgi:hypothetical protein
MTGYAAPAFLASPASKHFGSPCVEVRGGLFSNLGTLPGHPERLRVGLLATVLPASSPFLAALEHEVYLLLEYMIYIMPNHTLWEYAFGNQAERQKLT